MNHDGLLDIGFWSWGWEGGKVGRIYKNNVNNRIEFRISSINHTPQTLMGYTLCKCVANKNKSPTQGVSSDAFPQNAKPMPLSRACNTDSVLRFLGTIIYGRCKYMLTATKKERKKDEYLPSQALHLRVVLVVVVGPDGPDHPSPPLDAPRASAVLAEAGDGLEAVVPARLVAVLGERLVHRVGRLHGEGNRAARALLGVDGGVPVLPALALSFRLRGSRSWLWWWWWWWLLVLLLVLLVLPRLLPLRGEVGGRERERERERGRGEVWSKSGSVGGGGDGVERSRVEDDSGRLLHRRGGCSHRGDYILQGHIFQVRILL